MSSRQERSRVPEGLLQGQHQQRCTKTFVSGDTCRDVSIESIAVGFHRCDQLPPPPAGGAGSPVACIAISTEPQAVVKSEAKPFSEARNFLPALKAATRWAAIEESWGFARALASELSWRRDNGTPSSCSAARRAVSIASVAPTAAVAAGAGGVDVEEQDETGLYCICRGQDYGEVMVECDACSEWFHASW